VDAKFDDPDEECDSGEGVGEKEDGVAGELLADEESVRGEGVADESSELACCWRFCGRVMSGTIF